VFVQIGSDTLRTHAIGEDKGWDWAGILLDFLKTASAVLVGGLVTAITTYFLAQKQAKLNLDFEREKDFRVRFSRELLGLLFRTEKDFSTTNRSALAEFMNSELPLYADRFSDELAGRLRSVGTLSPKELDALRKEIAEALV
jgi:hypothetical protein